MEGREDEMAAIETLGWRQDRDVVGLATVESCGGSADGEFVRGCFFRKRQTRAGHEAAGIERINRDVGFVAGVDGGGEFRLRFRVERKAGGKEDDHFAAG